MRLARRKARGGQEYSALESFVSGVGDVLARYGDSWSPGHWWRRSCPGVGKQSVVGTPVPGTGGQNLTDEGGLAPGA